MKAINSRSDVTIAHCVQRATSLWARSRGLIGRKGFESGNGLLIEPCSGIHTFGMSFPIDAIFLNKEGVVVHLVQDMKPMRFSRYLFHARSVLELPAGTIERAGVQLGDRLAFEE
ncbi:MAG: DUF192 domain-containing protein [Chloroflexota bacterium]